MFPKKKNKYETRIFNQNGEDVTPKRLTDENYPIVEAPTERKLEHATTKLQIDWFRSRVHRDHPEKTHVEELAVSTAPPRAVKIFAAADLQAGKQEKLFLKLSETPTIVLLDIGTRFSREDPEDIALVNNDNATYIELTTGKGVNRKRSTAETQTSRITEKSKGTVTAEIHMRDNFVNASAWDLFDTYAQIDGAEAMGIKEFEMLIETALKTRGVADTATQIAHLLQAPVEAQAEELFESGGFRHALLITERLLASNNFQVEQSVFKKHSKSRYDEVEPSNFSYDVEELWVFDKGFEYPMTATALDWNPYNSDLLAVGYGNFYFGEADLGLVCVWSPKNPTHPEREYYFNDPVTSLSYSRTRPNILAIGCGSGDIYIADVSTAFGNIRILGRDKIKLRHGPVWKVEWFIRKEVMMNSEDLLAVGEGGVLIRFTFPDDSETTDILKLEYTAAITTSHFVTLRKGSSKKAPEGVITTQTTFSKKSLSGLWFSLLQNGTTCYVSTKEGVIIKCIVRDPCKTDATFLGHDGPIYNIEHSPFTSAIYFTCGADWCLRIWIEGIYEPILTLPTTNAVVSAKWSPTIGTILATLSGTELALWDLARNATTPARVVDFPQAKPFSSLMFSAKGTNIVVGDQQGFVRVLHLSQLPRMPFLQAEALTAALQRGLFTNPSLLSKFTRAAQLHKQSLKTKIEF